MEWIDYRYYIRLINNINAIILVPLLKEVQYCLK